MEETYYVLQKNIHYDFPKNMNKFCICSSISAAGSLNVLLVAYTTVFFNLAEYGHFICIIGSLLMYFAFFY